MDFLSQDNDSLSCLNLTLLRNSCQLKSREYAEYDAIAGVRMIVSSLSILGAVSIIVSAIARRQVMSPKVHPIFVLSVADFLLALLWVVGAILWLRRAPSRVWCFAASLPTVILECVSVNLTLVYALLAYSSLKQKSLIGILTGLNKSEEQVWPVYKTIAAYLIAWCLPMVTLMIIFGSISAATTIVTHANECSCWCLPVFGNVVPYAFPKDRPTARYIFYMRMLLVTYGLGVGTNYLVVFVLLVIIYHKILKKINRMRMTLAQNHEYSNYGATEAILIQGQSKAKKRIIYFIAVFIVNGLFNFLLSYGNSAYQFARLAEGPGGMAHSTKFWHSPFHFFYIGAYILQSITVPLQGFLNAIVYGWTRDDFLNVMAVTRTAEEELDYSGVSSEVEKLQEDSGIHASIGEAEHPFTHTITITSDSTSDED